MVAGSGLAARMPDRPLTTATAAYAAGASLAAITLVYVFGPTFFFDDEAANSSRSSRKKSVVGLANPANDCFINSVLQVLAGLPELRLYLIREMHRRKLDGHTMYDDLSGAREEHEKDGNSKPLPEWKIVGLQQGSVTAGLKDVLDALNERPIYRKTISAQSFIRVVESAYRTRVSRSQQDAQEFLQIVAERLADEYYAGRRVRRRAKKASSSAADERKTSKAADAILQPSAVMHEGRTEEPILPPPARPLGILDGDPASVRPVVQQQHGAEPTDEDEDEEPHSFPLEGKLESTVECSYCHFKPRPQVSSFVTLTLHVPQNEGSTSLDACFDGMLKMEQIDDFTCDKCRLEHALHIKAKQLSKTSLSKAERSRLEQDQRKLEATLHVDPERPPEGVSLPDLSTVPKRRISRHMRIAAFPRILAIHLSRSVWDSSSSSSKNSAKVSFPETLPLGGLLDRRIYRLLGVVTHKGAHNSGHYETFRRQVLAPPRPSNVNMGTGGIYSLAGSPRVSAPTSPRGSGELHAEQQSLAGSPHEMSSPFPSLPPLSPATSSASQRSSGLGRAGPQAPTSVPRDSPSTHGFPTLSPERETPQSINLDRFSSAGSKRDSSFSHHFDRVRRRKGPDRWWRISDEKVKESRTSDVLAMQREVYLLFYEVVDAGTE